MRVFLYQTLSAIGVGVFPLHIEAARVLGALVRAAKGNVMSTSFGGSRIAREQSEAEKGLREKCGARSGPLVLKGMVSSSD